MGKSNGVWPPSRDEHDDIPGTSPGRTEKERAYTELRLALATGLRDRRRMMRMTQVELARLMKSSQSRVAKMEAGDPTVSLDLIIRCLLALGASNMELARVMAHARLLARRSR